MRAPLTVAITGATGMVGSHLAADLVERGHCVVALAQPSSDARVLEPLRAGGRLRLERVRLSDPGGLRGLLRGVDAVVHAAACVDPSVSRATIHSVNVGGTRAVLEAAIGARVRQLLYVGSLSTVSGLRDRHGLTEETPLQRCGDPYADTKLEAEELVMAEAARSRIAVTTFRPGFVYGPRERAWMPQLIESLARGRVRLVHGGRKETNVVYVRNVCRAIANGLAHPVAFGQVYNLTDGERVTKKELFDAVSEGLGLPAVTRSAPALGVAALCRVVPRISPLLPIRMRRRLTRYSLGAYRLLALNQGFDVSKAKRDLGYADRIPFAVGMAETLRWFRAQGFGAASPGEVPRGSRARSPSACEEGIV